MVQSIVFECRFDSFKILMQELKKLRGSVIHFNKIEFSLTDYFRENESEHHRIYYHTSNQMIQCKIYDMEDQDSAKRFRIEKNIYQSKNYPELASCLDASICILRRKNFGVIILGKLPRSSSLADIPPLTSYELLSLCDIVLSFLARLQSRKEVYLNLNMNTIHRNFEGQFCITDPEFLAEQDDAERFRDCNGELMDWIGKDYKFRAPELLDVYSKAMIDVRSDLFSFGCALYQLSYKTYPFSTPLAASSLSYSLLNETFFSQFISKVFKPRGERAEISQLRVLLELQKKKMPQESKIMNSGSTNLTRSSNILSNLGQIINRISTQTQSWYIDYTENDQSVPDEKYLNLIIAKLYKSEAKAEKLRAIMLKYINSSSNQFTSIKTLLMIIHIFRRVPNSMMHEWDELLKAIDINAAGDHRILSLLLFCDKKIEINRKMQAYFRGNFYFQDFLKFKLFSFEHLLTLESYVQWITDAARNFSIARKIVSPLQNYCSEVYCDEVHDAISTLFFITMSIKKDNELNLRKDDIRRLKPLQINLKELLKKVTSLSNIVDSHAIYSIEVDYFCYQEEFTPKEKPIYTSLEYFYRFCPSYKGLCVPKNFVTIYTSGTRNMLTSLHTKGVTKRISSKNHSDFSDGQNQMTKLHDSKYEKPRVQRKSLVSQQEINLLELDKKHKQKQQIIDSIFGSKNSQKDQIADQSGKKNVGKSKEVEQTITFDQFFNIGSSLSQKQNKEKKSSLSNFAFFDQLLVKRAPQNKIESKPRANTPQQVSSTTFFGDFCFDEIKKKSQGNENKFFDIDWKKLPAKLSLLDEILSGLKLKELKEAITQNQSYIKQFSLLKIGKSIGGGSAGEVYLGTCGTATLAVKKVKTENPGALKQFERELLTYLRIKQNHNLVSLVGLSKSGGDYYLLTEYCTFGSLFDLLHKKAHVIPLSWRQKIEMALQVGRGMEALHNMKPPIIHRDLKSLNVFVTEKEGKLIAKVADFGLSRSPEADSMTNCLGTLHWMAPELLDNKQYSIKVDVYSFAIVLWEICSRKTPYSQLSNPGAIYKYVLDQKRPNLDAISSGCPKEIQPLLAKCWAQDPNERPTFGQIIEVLSKIVTM